MATIYLIRHCESEGNACRRAQAQTDALVTRKGFDQCEALRQHFADMRIDAVYASDTYRAIKTVEPIALDRGIPVRIRFLLREIATGVWEDMAWGNIAQDYPEEHRIWHERPWDLATPGANSYKEVSERVIFTLRRIAKDVGPDGVALVATHSCSIKAALCGIYGWSFQRVLECGHGENCSYSKLNIDEDGNITAEFVHESKFMPRHLLKSWQGIAGSDVNMAINPCVLPRDSEILLALASADAAERGEAFDADAYLAEAAQQLHKAPWSLAIAYLHNKPVGYVRCGTDSRLPDNWSVIRRMYMIPALQGKGYGDQLYGHATREMRYAGMTMVAAPKQTSPEEQRIIDRFVFEPDSTFSDLYSMSLFCPKPDYPVLP